MLLLIYYALPVVCTSRYILLAKRSMLTRWSKAATGGQQNTQQPTKNREPQWDDGDGMEGRHEWRGAWGGGGRVLTALPLLGFGQE